LFDAQGGKESSVSELKAVLDAARPEIEGVTFLGGEPFEQAEALAALAAHAHRLGLSVMTFSGETLETLQARADAGTQALLRETDLLVDGRYDSSQPETQRKWVGSRNQRFHFLSSTYAPGIERLESTESVDVWIRPDGTVEINGWPEGWGGLQRV
jgi:anaerobic ribonucleoside-triphosphate reductase activating protein